MRRLLLVSLAALMAEGTYYHSYSAEGCRERLEEYIAHIQSRREVVGDRPMHVANRRFWVQEIARSRLSFERLLLVDCDPDTPLYNTAVAELRQVADDVSHFIMNHNLGQGLQL